MSDSIWYYARGEAEQGPISTSQIKALAAAGALRRDDLVWKEGMENWLPASDVEELFPGKRKSGELSRKPDATPKQNGSSTTKPTPTRPSSTLDLDVASLIYSVGRTLVVLGVLIVLMSRGCDSLGGRKVVRLQAIAESAETDFQRNWDREKALFEDERTALNDNRARKPAEQDRLQRLPELIATLDRDKSDEQRTLRRGRWLSYQIAAEQAEVDNRMWAYWRQLGFLFGTMVLAVGLLFVTPTSEGPERWISLAMLTVILYSVYASNSVWGATF